MKQFSHRPFRRIAMALAVAVATGLAAPAYADTGTTKIRINMREAPDLSTNIVSTLAQGAKLEILGYDGEFAMVQTPDGKVGYLKSKYMDITKAVVAAPEPEPEPAPPAAAEAPAAVPAAPAAPAAPAVAQAPATESTEGSVALSKISVTGSRLRRTDIEGASPIIEVSRADIERIGLADLADVIRQLPVVTGSPLSTRTNNGGDGSTSVDLRGIGPTRTLVLINGRRDIAGNDFSTIPLAMVERIEVLGQGASAIYGADAVSGVVNIITRTDFEGVEISGFFSRYDGLQTNPAAALVNDPALEGSDGDNVRASLVIGGGSDRGRFTAGFEYNKQDPVYQGNLNNPQMLNALRLRDFDDIAAAGLGAFNNDVDGDGTVGIDAFGGSSAQLNGFFNVPEGGPFDAGIYSIGADGQPRLRTPEDAYNFAPVNFLQTPFTRNNFFFSGDYALENGHTVFTEARYSGRRSGQALAPLPYFSLFDPGVVAADNVFNPFEVELGDVRRRIAEVGNRQFSQEINQIQFMFGMRGDVSFLDGWVYDGYYQYGRVNFVNVDQGQFAGSRLINALGPSFFNDDGVATCGTPDAPIAGCVPLNLFGNVGSITQEMLDYVAVDLVDTFTGTRNLAAFSVNGAVASLPAGDINVALGYEFRKEKFGFTPDSGKATGAVTGNTGAGLAGGYDVESIYLEGRLPILSGVPGAQVLEATAGIRFDDYSTLGSNDVFQASLMWQPVETVLVRAAYSEVFKEPSIIQLFSPQSDNFPMYQDPCSNGTISSPDANAYADLTPEQQSRCTAQGIPEGGYFQSNDQPRGLVGGNPNLGPEFGETYNFGVVWDPGFFPGGSFTLDVWSVDLDNAIATIAEETIVDQCILAGDAASCALINRFDDGQINSVIALAQNIGNEKASGIDLGVNHLMNAEWGTLRSRFLLSKLDERESTVINTVDAVGKFQPAAAGLTRGVYPEYKGNLTFDWNKDIYAASVNVDYLDDVSEDLPGGLSRNVGAQYYFDTVFRVMPVEGTLLSFGINNLFDRDPPFIAGEFNAFTDTDTYRLFGRQLYVAFKQTF